MGTWLHFGRCVVHKNSAGAMEDSDRPVKRPRLGQASIPSIQVTSPVDESFLPPSDAKSIRGAISSPECELSLVSTTSFNEQAISQQKDNFQAAIKVTSSPEDSYKSNDQCTKASALVCFGSITGFSVSKINPISHPVSLQLNDSEQLHRRADDTTCGKLAPRDMKLLSLFNNEGVEFDLLWIPAPQTATSDSGTLWVTLYGGKTLGRYLGDTLQNIDVYLQEPIHAERDVLYWNPHKFQNTEGLRTISLRHSPQSPHPEVDHAEVVNVLKHFTSEDDLPETRGCAASLRTTLKSHQMRGLTFMIRREHGWLLNVDKGDVWSMATDLAGNTIYRNNVDNSQQYEAPDPFHGGIIADDMGLGKTLSMISLIVHDKSVNVNGRHTRRATTLIVVPPSLLSNWEAEIREHTAPGHLSWFLYHGRDRCKGAKPFSNFNIVFTTYSTLTNEWRTKGRKTRLFMHHWHRVILDEAHFIKDSTTTTSRATRDLNADRRWVMTATPIQNRLSELFSLFQFLRIYPYAEYRSTIWEADNQEQAVERLKLLLDFIMLRRLNGILALPERDDLTMSLEMDGLDKARYDLERQATIQLLDDIISSDSAKKGYVNAISKINALRMVCNLGRFMDTKDTSATNQISKSPDNVDLAGNLGIRDDSLYDGDLTGSLVCVICGQMISASRASSPASEHGSSGTEPSNSDPLDHISPEQCQSCFSDAIGLFETSQDGLLKSQLHKMNSSRVFSTKVEALVNDLKTQQQATKSIVFSFWTSTLDLASTALAQAGFAYLQVDGKTAPKQRVKILKQFSELETPTVLLMSLSCGAIGLNLTAASRVYLMEPQWNPAIEEQALARVYRLGQTQPVVTIRFFIKESIEEYVREVQLGKKELVHMLLSKDRGKGQTKVKELRNALS